MEGLDDALERKKQQNRRCKVTDIVETHNLCGRSFGTALLDMTSIKIEIICR